MSNFEASKLPADASADSATSEKPANITLANGAEADASPTKLSDPLSVAYKIEKAKDYKEKGNAFFKAGEFKKAITQYSRVFAYTTGLKAEGVAAALPEVAAHAASRGTPTSEEALEIDALQVTVWSNLGICCLRLKQGVKALGWLEKALAKDPKHFKALCNAGRACLLLNELDKAKAFLEEAASINPGDAMVKKELSKLPALYAKQDAKEKATWQAAFKKM